MTPEDRRARAYAAQALIDDPTLRQGLNELENDIRSQWENCGSLWGAWATRRKRERLWIELQSIKALRQKLAAYASQARE